MIWMMMKLLYQQINSKTDDKFESDLDEDDLE
jgi:hypothetical protein